MPNEVIQEPAMWIKALNTADRIEVVANRLEAVGGILAHVEDTDATVSGHDAFAIKTVAETAIEWLRDEVAQLHEIRDALKPAETPAVSAA